MAAKLQRLRGIEAAGDPLRARRAPSVRRGSVDDGAPQRASRDRHDRRRAVAARKQPADRMHQRQRRRPRRECEQDRSAGPRGKLRQALERCRAGDNGSGSPCRRHDRSARAPGRACRRPTNSMRPPPRSRGARSRARSISVGDRSIATTSAPRRAASTAKAPVPQPASSRRAPLDPAAARRAASSRICVAAGAHGRADAADRRIGGQPRPRLDRGAVEIGFDRRDVRADR